MAIKLKGTFIVNGKKKLFPELKCITKSSATVRWESGTKKYIFIMVKLAWNHAKLILRWKKYYIK